jgi:hypothetical protein
LKNGRSPEHYAQTRPNHFTLTRRCSGPLSTSAIALVRIGNRRLRGRVSDRPIVDGPLIDTSLRISTATIAHNVTLRITLVCNAILRQRRTAATDDANDRQFQFHGLPVLLLDALIPACDIAYVVARQSKSKLVPQPLAESTAVPIRCGFSGDRRWLATRRHWKIFDGVSSVPLLGSF